MEIAEAMVKARDELDRARVHTPREWRHKQKMERKELDRFERGSRRSAEYEKMKADAPRSVAGMRKWLKSPYAFRTGGE